LIIGLELSARRVFGDRQANCPRRWQPTAVSATPTSSDDASCYRPDSSLKGIPFGRRYPIILTENTAVAARRHRVAIIPAEPLIQSRFGPTDFHWRESGKVQFDMTITGTFAAVLGFVGGASASGWAAKLRNAGSAERSTSPSLVAGPCVAAGPVPRASGRFPQVRQTPGRSVGSPGHRQPLWPGRSTPSRLDFYGARSSARLGAEATFPLCSDSARLLAVWTVRS
jgi:hypothetical protein